MSEEQVRFWVRDEIRKILEAGLMYTAGTKPQPQAKPAEPQPAEKKESQGVVVNLDNIAWEEQPATEKGPWEKSMSKPIDYYTIRDLIETKKAEGKAGVVYMDGYLIWLNEKDESLGRRKK